MSRSRAASAAWNGCARERGRAMSQALLDSEVRTTVQPQQLSKGAEPERPPALRVRSFGLTDPGKVRDSNEDQFLITVLAKELQIQQASLPLPKVQYGHEQGYLFVVAD